MKKFLIFISIILISVCSYGQAIIQRSTGSNTVQDARLSAQYNLFLPRYADTTAALSGTNEGIDSCGSIIFTYDVMALWFRSCYNGSKRWIQILPAGGGTGGLGAWTTTLNTTIPTDLSLNGYFGTTAANGIGFYTNNTQRVILPSTGLAFNQLVSDTTANKVMTYNPSTKNWGYGYWYGGSGATPTWQQTLTAGSNLTQGNQIDGGNFDFEINNTRELLLSANDSAYFNGGFLTLIGATSGSHIRITNDSIDIHPPLGKLIIDTLNNETTQNTLMGWVETSGANRGKVGYITVTSPLSLSSGALSLSTVPVANGGTGSTSFTAGSVIFSNGTILTQDNSNLFWDNTAKALGIGTATPTLGKLQIETSGAAGGGITLRNTTAGAYSTMDFYNDGGFNGQFLFTGSTYSNNFFVGNQFAFANYASTGSLGFLAGGASGFIKFGAGSILSGAEIMRIIPGAVGIGDATPASLFTVGSGDLFQVNTSGDLIKLKNVTYSWPSSNSSGVLTNNGSGTLSWAASFALTNGSGTTASGTAVDLGGTVTAHVAINDDGSDWDFDIGRSNSFDKIRMAAASSFEFNGAAVQMNFYGAGAATFDASGNISSVSDIRLKDLQGMYEVGLKQLMKINPIVYKWKPESHLETKHDYIGFSAQNIKDALGENAIGINRDGYMSIQDRAILSVITNSIKELKYLNDEQQKEIDNLKKEVKRLNNK